MMNQPTDPRTVISDLPQRFCINCSHHFSYHILIPREKWEEYGIKKGAIPWTCQYEECDCDRYQPYRSVGGS